MSMTVSYWKRSILKRNDGKKLHEILLITQPRATVLSHVCHSDETQDISLLLLGWLSPAEIICTEDWTVNMGQRAPERRAVIDVGTNSARLLVTEVEGTRLKALHSASEATR